MLDTNLRLGAFKVIGDVKDYPIPNVLINVERHNNATFMNVLIDRVKHLNLTKSQRQFKVHIVAMTKKDARDACKALKDGGVPCLCLTSNHVQSEKEDIMKTWEEGRDQCMVSTIVDGIDNGNVENGTFLKNPGNAARSREREGVLVGVRGSEGKEERGEGKGESGGRP